MAVPSRPLDCRAALVPVLKQNQNRSRMRIINTGFALYIEDRLNIELMLSQIFVRIHDCHNT